MKKKSKAASKRSPGVRRARAAPVRRRRSTRGFRGDEVAVGGTSVRSFLKMLASPSSQAAVRLPDLLTFPTGLVKSSYRVSVGTIANGAGIYEQLVRINPGLNTGLATTDQTIKMAYATAYAGGVVSAISGQADPIVGSANSSFAGYRTLAMSVRVLNTTPLLSRCGLAVYDRLPYNSGVGLIGSWVGSVLNHADTEVVDATCPGLGELELCWEPGNMGDIDFNPPTATNANPSLWVGITGSVAQTFEVLIDTIYEYQAVPAFEALASLEMSSGSRASVVEGWAATRTTASREAESRKPLEFGRALKHVLGIPQGIMEQEVPGIASAVVDIGAAGNQNRRSVRRVLGRYMRGHGIARV